MVGVAKNDFGVDIIAEFVLVHSFDRPYGAHGHKDGSGNGSMIGVQHSCACRAFGVGMFNGEKKRLFVECVGLGSHVWVIV